MQQGKLKFKKNLNMRVTTMIRAIWRGAVNPINTGKASAYSGGLLTRPAN